MFADKILTRHDVISIYICDFPPQLMRFLLHQALKVCKGVKNDDEA